MGVLRALVHGVKALFRASERNGEIDEEIRGYIEAAVEEKVRRGITRSDAMRMAKAEMGSGAGVRDKVWRAGWESWVDTAWRELTYTLRRLSRSPGLVLTVIFSIGLGVGANATIFSIVSRFVLRGAAVGNPATLLSVYNTHDGEKCCNNLSMPVYRDVREQAKSFSDVAAYYELIPGSIGGKGEPERAWGQAATANYFDVAQVRMKLGRGFAESEERSPVIVLGYDLWRRRFDSDPAIASKVVSLSGHPYTVVGVAPAGYRGLHFILDPQFWVPLGRLAELVPKSPDPESRPNHWLQVVARMRPGVTRRVASAEMDLLAKRFEAAHPESDKGDGFLLTQAELLPPRDKPAILMFLTALSVVVLLVLCIACANVANLLLAQAGSRQREMGVRIALGATRTQLLRQMLLESVLLALGGGVIGVGLSVWGTSALSSFRMPAPIPLDTNVPVDWRVILYTFLLSVAAGLVFGMVPAWRASRPLMPNALKGEDALSRPGLRVTLRSVLVVAQIAISCVLLCGTGLFLRSLERAAAIDVGFRSHGVLMMSIDPQVHGYTPVRTVQLLTALRQRVSALPGVMSVASTDIIPLENSSRSDRFVADGRPVPAGGSKSGEMYMVSPHYFETMGIAMVAGSDLGEENPTGPKVAVVNEQFAESLFGHDNPIGQTVRDGDLHYRIAGVVKNVKARTIGEDQRGVLYRSINQNIAGDPSFNGYALLIRYEGDAATLSAAVHGEILRVDPSLAVFNAKTIEEHMRDALFLPRIAGTLFTVFGVSGLLLASVGLYSVMSYAVSRRTQEIGIRMALGAQTRMVQRMIVSDGMKLTLIAVALGLPAALAAAKLATSILYGVGTSDALTFTVTPLVLIVVALVACWIPSRRATRVDPIKVLRCDG